MEKIHIQRIARCKQTAHLCLDQNWTDQRHYCFLIRNEAIRSKSKYSQRTKMLMYLLNTRFFYNKAKCFQLCFYLPANDGEDRRRRGGEERGEILRDMTPKGGKHNQDSYNYTYPQFRPLSHIAHPHHTRIPPENAQ